MLVVDKRRYKMLIYEDKKEVHIQVIGFLRPKDVDEYEVDLTATISKVQKSQYVLVVDATLLSPLPYTVAKDLGQTMMVYTTFGLKDVYVVYPKSKISYVQVRNGTTEVGFPGHLVFSTSEIPAMK